MEELPASQLKLHGTYRPDRHGGGARGEVPQFGGEPERPKYLKGHALELWNKIVPELVSLGIAKRCDSSLLVAHCETWAHYLAADELAKQKPTDRNVVAAICMYHRMFMQTAAQLGLTPASRRKLRVNPASAPKDGLSNMSRKR